MLDTIDKIEFQNLNGLKREEPKICCLELTVTTGFEEVSNCMFIWLNSFKINFQNFSEKVAALEVKEKLGAEPIPCRGRLLVDIELERAHEVIFKNIKLRNFINL